MKMPAQTTQRMLLLLSGWIVWSICFVVLYATLYLGCVFMMPPPNALSSLNALLIGLWLVHMAVLAWLAWKTWPLMHQHAPAGQANGEFLGTITVLSNIAALVGAVWLGIPAFMVPPCPTGW